MQVTKGPDGRYYKPCFNCGTPQSYLRRNYAEISLSLNKKCKKCSSGNNSHKGWHRNVRISWFNKFKTGADTRGIFWGLTVDDVADLMELQNSCCALTGWELEFPEAGQQCKAPASLDRIDSKKGYTKDNTQIVTRQVNMMKQHYSQEDFISVCKAVADKYKQ
jgi:hypothetical protein